MKSGTYKVSFTVDLRENLSIKEAEKAVAQMVSDACDDDQFPEVEFELIEEFEEEYNTEEETVRELSF